MDSNTIQPFSPQTTVVNKTALCILTRTINKPWCEFIQNFKNYDLYMVIDDPNAVIDPELYPNIHIIYVADEMCRKHNYYKSSSWTNLKDIVAWDRALCYFNQINQKPENIWFLEDDVFLMNEQILIKMDQDSPNADLLCPFHEVNLTGDIRAGWNHWVNVIHRIGTPWAHSLISISRLSRRLLDRIDEYLNDRHLMIIEALFNTLAMHHGYEIQNPPELATTITYNDRFDYDAIDETKVYHPIKKIEDHSMIRDKYTRV
jgi:hypothetical protein